MIKSNKTFRPTNLLAVTAIFWVFFSLLGSQTAPKKFVKVYFPDGQSITAELAASPGERETGLMFRQKLGFDQGMLFVFEEEGVRSFWMKNMLFPLDIIWLDKDKRVVYIEKNAPPCKKDPCPTYTSQIPAMFVLELKAGSAERKKLKVLDRLDFILPNLVSRL